MKTNRSYIMNYNYTILDYGRKVKNETNFEQKFRNFHFALSQISVLLSLTDSVKIIAVLLSFKVNYTSNKF